jgi:hypothetical protein
MNIFQSYLHREMSTVGGATNPGNVTTKTSAEWNFFTFWLWKVLPRIRGPGVIDHDILMWSGIQE